MKIERYLTNKMLLLTSIFAPINLAAQERPNIIYILTDQQTATAMSCVGNTDIHTPNIDRLAQSGILFKNAYCAAPLSGPSRAAMFTGHFLMKLVCQAMVFQCLRICVA